MIFLIRDRLYLRLSLLLDCLRDKALDSRRLVSIDRKVFRECFWFDRSSLFNRAACCSQVFILADCGRTHCVLSWCWLLIESLLLLTTVGLDRLTLFGRTVFERLRMLRSQVIHLFRQVIELFLLLFDHFHTLRGPETLVW